MLKVAAKWKARQGRGRISRAAGDEQGEDSESGPAVLREVTEAAWDEWMVGLALRVPSRRLGTSHSRMVLTASPVVGGTVVS